MKVKTEVKMEQSGRRLNVKVKENNILSKNDFFEAVTGITTATPVSSKSKSTMLVLTPPESIKKLVDEVVKWKKIEKEAKAEKEFRETEVVDWTKNVQDEKALKGQFQKSYKVAGFKENLTYVSSDYFSAIKEENISDLQKIFGNSFSEFIQKKVTVSLNEEVMSSPELQAELMSFLPGEKFKKFFSAVSEYKTVDGFDQKIFSLQDKSSIENVREFVKQKRASLKA
jgi:hypothetical protein